MRGPRRRAEAGPPQPCFLGVISDVEEEDGVQSVVRRRVERRVLHVWEFEVMAAGLDFGGWVETPPAMLAVCS